MKKLFVILTISLLLSGCVDNSWRGAEADAQAVQAQSQAIARIADNQALIVSSNNGLIKWVLFLIVCVICVAMYFMYRTSKSALEMAYGKTTMITEAQDSIPLTVLAHCQRLNGYPSFQNGKWLILENETNRILAQQKLLTG